MANKLKLNFGEQLKKDWFIIAIIIAEFIVAVLVYPHLPDRVPSHWNIHGQVDNYSSRFWGAFAIPLLSLGMYILMAVLPAFDPKSENYQRFAGAYQILKFVLVLFFALLYATILMAAMGHNVPVDRFVIIGVGILFMTIGNFMSRFRHNYFVGIRTPWTLASESVWVKTHRLGSKLWALGGLLIVLTGLVLGGEKGFIAFFVIIAALTVVPMVYSYLLFRRERGI